MIKLYFFLTFFSLSFSAFGTISIEPFFGYLTNAPIETKSEITYTPHSNSEQSKRGDYYLIEAKPNPLLGLKVKWFPVPIFYFGVNYTHIFNNEVRRCSVGRTVDECDDLSIVSQTSLPMFEAGFKIKSFTFFGGYHPLTKFTFSDFEDSGISKTYRDINVEGTITALGVSYKKSFLVFNLEYTKTEVSKIDQYSNNSFKSNTYPSTKNCSDLTCDNTVISAPNWNAILFSIGIPFRIWGGSIGGLESNKGWCASCPF